MSYRGVGGREQHPDYGGIGAPMGGRGGGRTPGFVLPGASAPCPMDQAMTGAHVGVVFGTPAPPPSPSAATGPRVGAFRKDVVFRTPAPTPSPSAATGPQVGASRKGVVFRTPVPPPSPSAASRAHVGALRKGVVFGTPAPPPSPSAATGPRVGASRKGVVFRTPAPTPSPSAASRAHVGALRKGVVFGTPAPPPSSSAAPAPLTVRTSSPSTVRTRVPFQPAGVSALAPPGAAAGQPEVANHLLVCLIIRCHVSINPESKSGQTNREVLTAVIKAHGKTSLGGKLPAYDGRKSLHTAGSLPFESEEFTVTLVDPERKDKESYVTVPRSFLSTTFGHRGDIVEGLECWRGYYQSLRPTQMGLSLSIDISATSFFKPVTVIQVLQEFLNLRDVSRPLNDRDCVKIKKALRGVPVETNHQTDQIRRYKITWQTNVPMSQLMAEREHKITIPIAEKLCIITLGKKRKDTICIVLADNIFQEARAQMNKTFRKNVRARLSDVISVHQCPDVKYGKGVHIRHLDDTVEGITGNLFDAFLKSYFLEAYRPLRKGYLFLVRGGMRSMELKVVETDPAEYCIVAPDTEIFCDEVGYDDFGGVRKQMTQFRQLVELPLRETKFEKFGMSPSKGVLFYVPPGCGKALLAKAIANECHAKFISIKGPELLTMWSGEIEANGSEIFDKARGSAPCVLFFDELYSIAGQRGSSVLDAGGAVDRVLNQLPMEMDDRNAIQNKSAEDMFAQEFGIKVCTEMVPSPPLVPPPPMVLPLMDWPEFTEYGGLASAQPNVDEIMRDLCSASRDQQRVTVNGGMIKDLTINFRKNTGRSPERVIFRDGISDGQFCHVLVPGTDTVQKAHASFEKGHLPPVSFMVNRRRHHTSLSSKIRRRRYADCPNGGSTPKSGELDAVALGTVETGQSTKTGLNIQFFVKVNGCLASLQRTPESILGPAIFEAMSKSDCKYDDFYVAYANHVLQLDQSLQSQNIVHNSTIEVRPRMRGGAGLTVSLEAVPFEDRIQSFSFDDLFEQRFVPAELMGTQRMIRPGRSRPGTEHVLKKPARQIFHKLFEMIHLLHLKQISLHGNFTYKDILYLPMVDSYSFTTDIVDQHQAKYSDAGYELDMRSLGKILKKLLSMKWEDSSRGWRSGVYPLYVKHLLDTLNSMPNGASSKLAFKAFLRNHLAMLSPGAAKALILEVHRYIRYQTKSSQVATTSAMGNFALLSGNTVPWSRCVLFVPCFVTVYNFNKYYNDYMVSWFDFLRNFISHPAQLPNTRIESPPNFTLEDVFVAFAYHFNELISSFLCEFVMKNTFTSTHTVEDIFDKDWFNTREFVAGGASTSASGAGTSASGAN